jgi:hypothetical protein
MVALHLRGPPGQFPVEQLLAGVEPLQCLERSGRTRRACEPPEPLPGRRVQRPDPEVVVLAEQVRDRVTPSLVEEVERELPHASLSGATEQSSFPSLAADTSLSRRHSASARTLSKSSTGTTE